MIDLTKNLYGKFNGNEMKYVLQALDSDYVPVDGRSWTQRLEEKFCEVLGVRYAVSCNSGTSGLHAALYAAGVGPGDEVISPALTVIMDALTTVHRGATPVFADVDPDTMNIDPTDVERKITPRTRAILVVSLQGLPCDMDPVMELATKHGLVVIEDTAQALLGTYKGRMAGTIGHLGVFSFENKKHITSGSEGGMVVSNDALLAERARKFAGIGYRHMTASAGRTSLAMSAVQDPNYERFDTLGLNYRMPQVCAAVGLGQLERVQEIVSRRQACARLIDEAVAGCAWLVKQAAPDGYVNSFYTYAVRYLGQDNTDLTWKAFYNKYKERGGDGFYGACMIPYLEPVFRNLVLNGISFQKGLCPVSEEIQQQIMQFKTNYRNLDVAKRKAEILRDLIEEIGI